MPSLREIRKHSQAVNSLWQMTNAMKKVAAARANRYRNQLKKIEPYAEGLEQVMSLLALRQGLQHPLLRQRPVEREVVVVMGSDRGLCGAHNLEIKRVLLDLPPPDEGVDREVVVCGRKLNEILKSPSVKPIEVMSRPKKGSVGEIRPLAEKLTSDYLRGWLQQVVLVRPRLNEKGRREVGCDTFLPVRPMKSLELAHLSPEIEPGSEELLDHLLPRYILSRLRTAFLESMALEEEARALAMQAATTNAEELGAQLKKQYRRARQERITRELLELVAAPASGGLA